MIYLCIARPPLQGRATNHHTADNTDVRLTVHREGGNVFSSPLAAPNRLGKSKKLLVVVGTFWDILDHRLGGSLAFVVVVATVVVVVVVMIGRSRW